MVSPVYPVRQVVPHVVPDKNHPELHAEHSEIAEPVQALQAESHKSRVILISLNPNDSSDPASSRVVVNLRVRVDAVWLNGLEVIVAILSGSLLPHVSL